MRTLNYLLKIITIMHPKFNLHWVVDVSKYGIQIFFIFFILFTNCFKIDFRSFLKLYHKN